MTLRKLLLPLLIVCTAVGTPVAAEEASFEAARRSAKIAGYSLSKVLVVAVEDGASCRLTALKPVPCRCQALFLTMRTRSSLVSRS